MNITKMKLTLVGICGVLLLPIGAEANGATLINDTNVLFTIDFSFTDELFDVSVPIAAESGVSYLDRVDVAGYNLERNNPTGPAVAEVNALVLSTQPIVDNKYFVESGETGNFTLIILATFAEPIASDYRVTLTKLPYFLNDRRTTVHQNQLDDIEPALLDI